MGVGEGTARELWAHAEALSRSAVQDFSHADARRALVTLAIAGAAGDREGFERVVAAVHRAIAKLGMDPEPLFDAAAALVDRDEQAAREVLITYPRRVGAARAAGLLGDR